MAVRITRHLLRAYYNGIFWRSLDSHGNHHARLTIAPIGSLCHAVATGRVTRTASSGWVAPAPISASHDTGRPRAMMARPSLRRPASAMPGRTHGETDAGALVSIHDLMPETLEPVDELLALLARYRVAPVTLLVVPAR